MSSDSQLYDSKQNKIDVLKEQTDMNPTDIDQSSKVVQNYLKDTLGYENKMSTANQLSMTNKEVHLLSRKHQLKLYKTIIMR